MVSLTSAQRLKNLGQAVCPARPAGLGSSCPRAGGQCPCKTAGGLLGDGDKEGLTSASLCGF